MIKTAGKRPSPKITEIDAAIESLEKAVDSLHLQLAALIAIKKAKVGGLGAVVQFVDPREKIRRAS